MRKQNCGELLKQIHCAMQKTANNELRAADLTFAQVHLLFTLQRQPDGKCSMKELEKKMGVAQSTTAGLVKRSGEKGLVECFEDSTDRRAKLVCITQKGLEVCRDTGENIRRSDERMLKNLTESEQDLLLHLLKKVYSAVSAPLQSAER